MTMQHRTMAVFFLNGLTLSTYLVRLPSLKAEHHLTDARLGAIGMLFALAALAAMQVAGRLPTRPVLRLSLVAMPVLLASLGVVHGQVAFAVLVTVLGAMHGATDAAMNTQAVTVELDREEPVLNRCHAAWSTSAIVASLAAAVSAQAGVSLATHLTAAAVVLLAGGLLIGPGLPAATRETPAPSATWETPAPAARRGGWTRPLIILGLTGTALMICEAAALGWGAIFLHDDKGASFGLAAIAVTTYMIGQTAGRLGGDRLTARIGQSAAFRAGAVVAAGGLAAVVLTPAAPVAVAGFAVMGLGMSILIPMIFSAAGRLAGAPTGVTVSRLTTFTYAGILVGPAVIGWSAGFVGLDRTLFVLVPALLVLAVGTRLPAHTASAAAGRA